MANKQIRNSLLLVLTALIWGLAFIAQTKGSSIGAFTFNGIRNLIGAAVLIPVILLMDKVGISKKKPVTRADKKLLWLGGTLMGIALCAAESLQQIGINMGAPAGKAGFLTAIYIILVPILGIFIKRKCPSNIWIGAIIAVAGLYFLCMTDKFYFSTIDLLLLTCAFCFSIQILLIDHFSPQVDPIRLSAIEFFVCGMISSVIMIFAEMGHTKESLSAWAATLYGWDAWIPILYLGVLSTGVAYTLQVVAQDGLNPTLASMIMSLESVFSLIFGWIILGQHLTTREFIGCGLMFAAIIIAQLPQKKKKTKS